MRLGDLFIGGMRCTVVVLFIVVPARLLSADFPRLSDLLLAYAIGQIVFWFYCMDDDPFGEDFPDRG